MLKLVNEKEVRAVDSYVIVWVVTKAKSSWVYQAERMASEEKRLQEPRWRPT